MTRAADCLPPCAAPPGPGGELHRRQFQMRSRPRNQIDHQPLICAAVAVSPPVRRPRDVQCLTRAPGRGEACDGRAPSSCFHRLPCTRSEGEIARIIPYVCSLLFNTEIRHVLSVSIRSKVCLKLCVLCWFG